MKYLKKCMVILYFMKYNIYGFLVLGKINYIEIVFILLFVFNYNVMKNEINK